MSCAFGEIVARCVRTIGQGDSVVPDIKRSAQLHYREFARKTDWQPLRRRDALTFTGLAENGNRLPADVVDVMAVQCETSGSEKGYQRAEHYARQIREGRPRWYYPQVASGESEVRDAITVKEGATVWTGEMTGAVTGDYVQFANEPGVYLITNAAGKAFSPAYWGPQIDGKTAVLNPPSARRIQIVDGDGSLDSGVVAVYYWKLPEPIYHDWQRIEIDVDQALYLAICIEILSPNKNRAREVQAMRDQLEDPRGLGELPDAISRNPKFSPPAIPVGRLGRMGGFGRSRSGLYPRLRR